MHTSNFVSDKAVQGMVLAVEPGTARDLPQAHQGHGPHVRREDQRRAAERYR